MLTICVGKTTGGATCVGRAARRVTMLAGVLVSGVLVVPHVGLAEELVVLLVCRVFRVAGNTICGVGRVTSSALYSMFTFHMRIMFFTVKITDRQLHPSFTLLIQQLVIFFSLA